MLRSGMVSPSKSVLLILLFCFLDYSGAIKCLQCSSIIGATNADCLAGKTAGTDCSGSSYDGCMTVYESITKIVTRQCCINTTALACTCKTDNCNNADHSGTGGMKLSFGLLSLILLVGKLLH
eukprot:TRINITY_DN8726_c0_g1_i1.p1 TRINITY_DN8726_c0_g1~~TRINITY_DN8726_c0_g1_i1.p1  ORF type:complete len:123 (-),score=15.06 TRINITY_DN8726_c0_g1_i1:73-441(-)